MPAPQAALSRWRWCWSQPSFISCCCRALKRHHTGCAIADIRANPNARTHTAVDLETSGGTSPFPPARSRREPGVCSQPGQHGLHMLLDRRRSIGRSRGLGDSQWRRLMASGWARLRHSRWSLFAHGRRDPAQCSGSDSHQVHCRQTPPSSPNGQNFVSIDGGHTWTRIGSKKDYAELATYHGLTYALVDVYSQGTPSIAYHLAVSTDLRSWRIIDRPSSRQVHKEISMKSAGSGSIPQMVRFSPSAPILQPPMSLFRASVLMDYHSACGRALMMGKPGRRSRTRASAQRPLPCSRQLRDNPGISASPIGSSGPLSSP